jgi:hypothetical protein
MSSQHRGAISQEIASVVNHYRDCQSSAKHDGVEIAQRRQEAEKARADGLRLIEGEPIVFPLPNRLKALKCLAASACRLPAVC